MQKKRWIVFIVITLLLLVFLSSCGYKEDDKNLHNFTFSSKGNEWIISGYQGISELTTPKEHKGLPVTGIAKEAFMESNLSKVVLSEGIKTIGDRAFANSEGLYHITIPKTVTTIGIKAFYACTSLREIAVDINNPNYKSIDGSLYTKDGNTLIAYCIGNKDTAFSIPEHVDSIYSFAFAYATHLNKLTLPKNLHTIGEQAFSFNAIDEFTISSKNAYFTTKDGIIYTKDMDTLYRYPPHKEHNDTLYLDEAIRILYDGAFESTNIKKIVLHSGLEIIGHKVFESSSLEEIFISPTVSQIGDAPFKECFSLYAISVDSNNEHYQDLDNNLYTKDGSLLISYALAQSKSSFSIPKGVTAIAEYAFYNTPHLTEIEIPNSIETIKAYALSSRNINEIIILTSTPPSIDKDTFSTDQNYTIYVPDTEVDFYKSYNDLWENISSTIKAISEK